MHEKSFSGVLVGPAGLGFGGYYYVAGDDWSWWDERVVRQSRFQAFSLRNYSLHADQMEELALDGILYARIMAETLADLYWRAHMDANDVEFVLAPPPRGDHISRFEGHLTHPPTIKSDILEEHFLWILDFDCCKHMSMDETGVEQAVVAFYRNDPFYPRPGRNNVKEKALDAV